MSIVHVDHTPISLISNSSPNLRATSPSLPANEWKVSRPMSNTQPRRKPGAGGIKPINTLGNKTFQSKSTSRTLETAATAGDNVQEYNSSPHFSHDHPSKRRKLDTLSPAKAHSNDGVQVVITKPDLEFFDREHLVSQPQRKLSSTFTSDSLSSVNSTHRQHFTDNWPRDLNNMLGRQKKPRKPNPKFASSPSSQGINEKEVIEVYDSQPSQTMDPGQVAPTTYPSRQNAILVRDDDNIEHIRNKPAPSQVASAKAQRACVIQVPSAFDALQDEEHARHAKQSIASKIPSGRPTTVRNSSPPLYATFVRDDASAKPTTIRDRMLATSIVSNNKSIAEGSEDELGHESVTRGTKRIAKDNLPRSLSPSNIKSTTFTRTTPAKRARRKETAQDSDQEYNDKSCETFKLAAFYTLSLEDASSNDLSLAFSRRIKAFIIQKGGSAVLRNKGGDAYPISSHHAQMITVTQEPPYQLGIEGSTDSVTGGRIWFDFINHKDVKRCLELLKSFAPDKFRPKYLDHDRFGRIFKASMENFKTARAKLSNLDNNDLDDDPELVAMKIREEKQSQTAQSRASATRDRTRSAQRGNDPAWEEPPRPLSTAPTSLRGRMISEFTGTNKRSEPRSSPVMESLTSLQGRATRTSRRIQDKDDDPVHKEPRVKQWTREHESLEWDSPLVYPSTGPKRTTVEAQDVERLNDGEFLNDNLISFCLRRLEENNPSLKDKVHIFNTFFYTSLSTKQGRRGFNYDAVKRWTKNIDIFTYPFVVVPVNANLHWFVTIICNLDRLDRKLEDEDEDKGNKSQSKTGSGSDDGDSMIDNQIGADDVPGSLLLSELPDSQEELNVREEVGRLSISDGEKLAQPDNDQDNEDRIIYELETPAVAPQSSNPKKAPARKAKRPPPPLPKLDTKQPTIITLDSLGAQHSTEVRNLKNYIVQEGREKRGMTIEFTEIKGMLAKGIPEQTNFCDCGVYLVEYVSEFLKNPSEFVRKVLSRELDENSDFANFDPSTKRAEIREQLIELEKVQSVTRRKQKKIQNDAKKQKAEQEAALKQVDGAVDDAEPSKSRATTPAARGSESSRHSKEVASSPAAPSVASNKTGVAGGENEIDAGVVNDSFSNGIHKAAHGSVD